MKILKEFLILGIYLLYMFFILFYRVQYKKKIKIFYLHLYNIGTILNTLYSSDHQSL